MVYACSAHRALRPYALAGIMVMAMASFHGVFAYSIVAAVALATAPVARRARSVAARTIMVCMMLAITLLWAVASVSIYLASTIWSVFEWSICIHWRAMSCLGRAMCSPLSTLYDVLLACASWVLFPITKLQSLQRTLLQERVARL